MPNTSLRETAIRFCEFRASKAQQMMIDEGLPAAAIIPQEARAEAWRGKKLKPTTAMRFAQPGKEQDPGTAKLLAEREAAERAKAKAKRAADKEARIIKARQKAALKGTPPATETEKTMTKTQARAIATEAAKTHPITKVAAGSKAKATSKKKAAKAPAKKKASKKSAAANARKPADGDRARYDWKAAEEKALGGKVPSAPDFSAPTHARFLPILKAIKEAVAAEDLKALKAIKINAISSTPKAMARYRDICVSALSQKA